MSLTFEDLSSGGGSKKDYPVVRAGVLPARIVHVVDLGVQKREFRGETKDPVRQLFINFELVNEEYKTDKGEVQRHRVSPRPFNVFKDPKAKIVQFLAAIDPANTIAGDFSKLANMAAMVNVVHSQKSREGKMITYANFGGVMPPPEGVAVKELSQPALVFSFDRPDPEVFKALPKFLQERIKQAVNYNGSKVQGIVRQLEAENKPPY